MIDQNELTERLFTMIFAAVSAGTELEKTRNSELIREKILDIVTTADMSSAATIQRILIERYPNDSIDQEDTTLRKGTSDYRFVVDPLDGTKQYFMSPMQIPIYCVSLALQQEKETLIGVVYDPVARDLYYASKGNGAFGVRLSNIEEMKGSELKEFLKMSMQLDVSNQETKRPQVLIELPSTKLSENIQDKYWEQIKKITPIAYRLRALGTGPLSICYVAGCNDVGAAIDFSGTTKIYDLLAAELIADESGAKVLHLNSHDPENVRYLVAKPNVFDQLVSIVS